MSTDNIGYYVPGMPRITPIGSEKLGADVPNADGINPASGYIYAGSLTTGSIPLAADRFYGVPKGATPGTLLTVASTLYAYPFEVPNYITLEKFGLYTTTGQTAGAGHAGIYADNGSGYPGSLIVDSGALIATSGAAAQYYAPTDGITLTPGWYWLASLFYASGTYPTVASAAVGYSSAKNSMLGSDTAAHLIATSAEATSGISVTQTYGALPTTFTAGGALILNADVPLVILAS